MEIFFVYGLVIIFFIALPLLIFFLMKEPVRDPDGISDEAIGTTSSQSYKEKSTQITSTIASYGLLAAIFALLFFVSIASQRHHTEAT